MRKPYKRPTALPACICGETFPLSSSYEKSLVLSVPFIIFITPKVSATRVQIYSHQLDLIQLIHQGLKFRDYISNSSMWIAECPFVSSDLVWSVWDVTVSNSVRATIRNPLSIPARHSRNLWTVMVYEQSPGRFRQWTKLSAGNTSQAEARPFSKAACFPQRASACLRLIGGN